MSTYKEIRGLKVRDYTTNPDNPIEGQLWYNTTDNVTKYAVTNLLGTWSTGGTLNQNRASMGAAGTQTAGIVASGHISPANTAKVEQYNGSSWTETTDVNSPRFIVIDETLSPVFCYTVLICFCHSFLL